MPNSNLESQLCALYTQQLEVYASLEQQTGALLTRPPVGVEADAAMVEVGHLMDEVTRMDAQIRTLRVDWDGSNRKAGPVLAGTLKQLEGVIVRVMNNIQQAEQLAASAKTRLEPKMRTEVQQRRMATAYAATAARE